MSGYMTPRDIARLRLDVREYLDRERPKGELPTMSGIISHTLDKGWNLLDHQMFTGWVQSNFRDRIDYRK